MDTTTLRDLAAKVRGTSFRTQDDVGNAARLLDHHGDDLRHVTPLGWHVWTGMRWERDTTGRVFAIAATLGDVIDREADQLDKLAADATAAEDKEQAKAIKAAAKTHRAWASSSRFSARIEAAVKIAARDPSIALNADALDADPWVLGVPNGAVNLRTGALIPPVREMLITKHAGAKYDAAAKCPTWDRFLAEVQPDADVRAFIARLAGYWLTGSVGDHVLPLFIGLGGNGKGVFLATISAMLADYGRTVSQKVWTSAETEHPALIAQLHGVRFAPSQELKQGAVLDAASLKNLTGGDRLAGRYMGKDWFEFTPTHKLVMACNGRPVVIDTSNGFWRRFAPVAWDVTPANVDTSLSTKLAAEMPGIMAWAMRGLADYLANGLGLPASVIAERDRYRASADPFSDFVSEECVRAADVAVTRSELYASYSRWCQGDGTANNRGQGERPLGARRFAERLREVGCYERANVRFADVMKSAKRERGWGGVRLKTDDDRRAEAAAADAEEQAAMQQAMRANDVDLAA